MNQPDLFDNRDRTSSCTGPSDCSDLLGPEMKVADLEQYKEIIIRQAKELYALPGAFPDEPDDRKRMRYCIESTAQIWLILGPQTDYGTNASVSIPGDERG